jgi:hypothetical protein
MWIFNADLCVAISIKAFFLAAYQACAIVFPQPTLPNKYKSGKAQIRGRISTNSRPG